MAASPPGDVRNHVGDSSKYVVGNHDTILGGLGRYEGYCAPAGMALQSARGSGSGSMRQRALPDDRPGMER